MSDLYDNFRAAALNDTLGDLEVEVLKVGLLPTSYTFDAGHGIGTIGAALVGSAETLAGVTVDADGVVDADDVTFSSVSRGEVNAVVIYKNSGDVPIAYIDGISVTPDGSDILVEWDAAGIFQL